MSKETKEKIYTRAFWLVFGVCIGILIVIVAEALSLPVWQETKYNIESEKRPQLIVAPPAPVFGFPPSEVIHPSYPTDLENNQNILGASHNVFLGKIVSQIGNKETQIGPRTQYSVEVIDNIKGELSGAVAVDMLGGYQDGKLVTIEGFPSDDFLLQDGATYLFATRYNSDENWHTIVGHPNGKKLITKDPALSISELSTLGKQDAKYKAWEKAYAEEVLINADVTNNNTRNSFESLPPEEKVAAQARADAALAALEASGVRQ